MSQLKALQKEFQDYLLMVDNEFDQAICATKNLDAKKRLNIYQDAYQSRLIEALACNFPKLQAYLGQKQFRDLALAYIEKFPSNFKSIRWYGEYLYQFIELHPALTEMPYLAEISKFEWYMTKVFDGTDADGLDESMVLALNSEQWITMRLKFLPTLYLLQFKWNIIPIWKSLEHNEKPPQPQLRQEAQHCILWRGNLINQFCSVNAIEACAFDGFIAGHDFLAVAESLEKFMPAEEAAAYLAGLLKGWLTAGLVTDIQVGSGEK